MFLKKSFFSWLIFFIGSITHSYPMQPQIIDNNFKGEINGALYYIIHRPTRCTLYLFGNHKGCEPSKCLSGKTIDHAKDITIAFYNNNNKIIAIANHSKIQKLPNNQLHKYAQILLHKFDETESSSAYNQNKQKKPYDALFYEEYVKQDDGCTIFSSNCTKFF